MSTDTADPTVQVDHPADGVARITLSRPARYNAINSGMHRELSSALRSLARTSDCRVIILTGEGPAFSSGQDLAELRHADDSFRVDELVRATYNKLVVALREQPQPVIAAINGPAVGAGASLALACDLRVCSTAAVFSQAFIRIALAPDTGASWLLQRAVGLPNALELALTGRNIDANEAHRIGLVNQICEPEDLMSRALELAAEIAQYPADAIVLTKRAYHLAASRSLEASLEMEAQLQQVAIHGDGHREGIAAFFEKREPRWHAPTSPVS